MRLIQKDLLSNYTINVTFFRQIIIAHIKMSIIYCTVFVNIHSIVNYQKTATLLPKNYLQSKDGVVKTKNQSL
jgi:hypothetical protein